MNKVTKEFRETVLNPLVPRYDRLVGAIRKPRLLLPLAFLGVLLVSSHTVAAKTPSGASWQADLGDTVKNVRMLDDKKHALVNNEGKVWLMDLATGKTIWNSKIKSFNKDGIDYHIVGERFLVSSGDKLQCYQVMDGKLLWEQKIPGIDQDDFKTVPAGENGAITASPNGIVLAYKDEFVELDITNGNLIRRFKPRLSLRAYNLMVWDLPGQKKQLTMLDGGQIALYDVESGKQLFLGKEFRFDSDKFNEKGVTWFYKSPDDANVLLVLEKDLVVIDTKENRELLRFSTGLSPEQQSIFRSEEGWFIGGNNESAYFSFSDNKLSKLPIKLGELRAASRAKFQGKPVLLLGLENGMAAIDRGTGNLIWRAGGNDLAGTMHRFITSTDDLAVVTYSRINTSGSDKGVALDLLAVNLNDGTVAYRSPVGFSQKVPGDTGLFGALGKAYMTGLTWGLGGLDSNASADLGFEYFVENRDNKLFFGLLAISVPLVDPVTRKGSGEGFCAFSLSDGKLIYNDRFHILDADEDAVSQATVKWSDSVAHLTGKSGELIAYDYMAGKRLWTLGKEIKGLRIMDTENNGGIVYAKYGTRLHSVTYNGANKSFTAYATGTDRNASLKIKEEDTSKPFGFLAIDAASGRLLWRADSDNDPALAQPGYHFEKFKTSLSSQLAASFARYEPPNSGTYVVKNFNFSQYYNSQNSLLYFSDMDRVYALKMGSDGGKVVWSSSLDKYDVGDFDFEDAFPVRPQLEQALRLEYADGRLLAFGPDGVASIDPANGNRLWQSEWSYDPKAVRIVPAVKDGKLLYCMDGVMARIDVATGRTDWTAKVGNDVWLYRMADAGMILLIDDEEITAYPLR